MPSWIAAVNQSWRSKFRYVLSRGGRGSSRILWRSKGGRSCSCCCRACGQTSSRAARFHRTEPSPPADRLRCGSSPLLLPESPPVEVPLPVPLKGITKLPPLVLRSRGGCRRRRGFAIFSRSSRARSRRRITPRLSSWRLLG